MLFTCSKTDQPYELRLEGTVDEVTSDGGAFGDVIAGYTVTGVSIGQHDAGRAHVFALSDSMGHRSVGRFAIRDDALRDARLEWVRSFDSEAEAEMFYDRFHNPPEKRPDDVITLRLDMSFDEMDTERARLFASWAVTYGCMFKVVNEFGPAAGNPEVEVTGFRERVRTWLEKEYVQPDGNGEPADFFMQFEV